MSNKKSTSQFILEAKRIHGDAYDYSITEYTGASQPISYYCKEHGLVQQSSASNHLAGKGCKLCKGKLITTKKTKSFEDFVEQANKIHPNLYQYSKADYKDRKTKTSITCNRCKTTFLQSPNAHLAGKGCNKCNRIKSTWEKEILSKNFRKINKKHMFVYKTTNLVNGKIYVGQHATNNLDDQYIGSGKLITRAIKKYGPNNFKFEIFQFAESYEELDALEKNLISTLSANDGNIGYNIHPGGLGGNAYIKVNQYDLNGKFIKTWNALIEASEQLSLSYKAIQGCAVGQKKSGAGFQWRFYNENENCVDIPPHKNKTRRAVNQYSADGTFIKTWPSAADAAEALNINASSIGNCCGLNKSVILIAGFVWRYTSEFPSEINIPPVVYSKRRKVSQFDMNWNLIKIFPSVNEASKEAKVPTSNISKCCQNKRTSAGGFKWGYFEEGKK